MHKPHDISNAETETIVRKTDSWSKDKKAVVGWAAATAGASILGWGAWATVAVFSLQTSSALACDQIQSSDRSSRERDKSIADMAAQQYAALMAQIAQVQAQCAEIQRELRRGNR